MKTTKVPRNTPPEFQTLLLQARYMGCGFCYLFILKLP